jgi:NAD(P)-dependent dehydrogenase (short-subunit alcohol dehydrogenase family)
MFPFAGAWFPGMQAAIVTGASSGIGYGCAIKLAQMGMAVWHGERRSKFAELRAVAPGVTTTPMVEHRMQEERFRKINIEITPFPRLGTIDAIAGTVAFLCSPGGSSMN